MKAIHISKRFILVILSTIILTLLCAPIYSDHLLSGLYQSRHNKTARIDIINKGKSQNRIEILEVESPSGYTELYPQNCKKANRQCAIVHVTTAHQWQHYKIKFKAIGKGSIKLLLRGPYIRGNNKRYPVLVDYRSAEINHKKILDESRTFWHDNVFKYMFVAQDGEVFELDFEARKHHWKFKDLWLYYSINRLLFLSVLILAFLFSHKAIQYIAKFKLLEHNSRIDIVFAVTFVLLLFLPMSRISTADKSTQENRILATYPAFFNQTMNLNYGKQFENWFNDRFFGRDFLIKLYSILKLYINNKYENGGAFLMKDNNWMFRKFAVEYDKPDTATTNEVINQINKLNQFCKDNNIKLYLLIVPSKESVYIENLPNYYQDRMKQVDYNQYLKDLAENFKAPAIIPFDELRNASAQDYTFFLQEHHWTDWGAYIGYRALMEVIKKDYPNIHITELDEYEKSKSKMVRGDWTREFELGTTTNLLAINKEYAKKNLHQTEYSYYTHKNLIDPDIVFKDYYKTKYYNNKSLPDAPKVLIAGSSMIENLMQFLPYSFSEVINYRLNKVKKVKGQDTYKLLKRYKKDILKYHPDIMIICVAFNNVQHLVNLTKD